MPSGCERCLGPRQEGLVVKGGRGLTGGGGDETPVRRSVRRAELRSRAPAVGRPMENAATTVVLAGPDGRPCACRQSGDSVGMPRCCHAAAGPGALDRDYHPFHSGTLLPDGSRVCIPQCLSNARWQAHQTSTVRQAKKASCFSVTVFCGRP